MPKHAFARKMPIAHRVDDALSDVSHTFAFLAYITPINGDAAWQAFRDGGCTAEPKLEYRPLEFDPDRLKRELYRLPIEKVEEPALGQLMHGKQEELDLQISMIRHRGSRRFFYGSLQLYGEPSDELVRLAKLVLDELPALPRDQLEDAETVSCEVMAQAAREEVKRYREHFADFDASVHIRADTGSLMVSGGDLLVPAGRRFARQRIEPLLHHEVGTHLVTYYNGEAQPLRLLCAGLARYDPTQEGLAVLAEFLCGGLTRGRLRLLAARVLVCARLVERSSFAEAYTFLVDELGFEARTGFDIVLRVFRGGGLTKDMIYLRGLQRVLAYFENGGTIDKLLIGKVALEQLPTLDELAELGLLHAPSIRPRYLELEAAQPRLARLRDKLSLRDIIREVQP